MEFLSTSTYFAVLLTLGSYFVGCAIQKKCKFCNPFLFAIVVIIVTLILLNMDYETYYSATEVINFMLTPATVCLAVPLYQQLQALKSNWKAILAGILSGVLANMVAMLGFSVLFGFSHTEYVTLLPKSITTAIGMGVAEQLGGYPAIAAAVIIITGILGNAIGETVLRAFRITDPIAKGVALGTSAHAIGTVKAIEMGETEGAMSSLSIAVAGIMTVIFATVYANFL